MEGNTLLALINRLRSVFVGRDELIGLRGSRIVPLSHGFEMFGLDASGGVSITLAHTAVSNVFGATVTGGVFSGLVIVNNLTNGICCLNVCGSAVVSQLASAAGYFSTVSGTASRINVFYGPAPYYDFRIENQMGVSTTLNVLAIRTRAGA